MSIVVDLHSCTLIYRFLKIDKGEEPKRWTHRDLSYHTEIKRSYSEGLRLYTVLEGSMNFHILHRDGNPITRKGYTPR